MEKLKILMAASEAGPYVRTGGLGDVIGALPAALGALGHEVKVVLPRYRSIDGPAHHFSTVTDSLEVPDVGGLTRVSVSRAGDTPPGVEFLFIECDEYYDRPGLYIDPATGTDFVDNDLRFAFFGRAALELARLLKWHPDVVHCHDWQAALIPAYLKAHYAKDPVLKGSATVLTIHNLGYQGLFEGEKFDNLGLPEEMFYAMTGELEFFGKLNFLKGGIALADWITTVSPRYAEEIQSGDEFGCGLEGVLSLRAHQLSGIINGADYSIWSPESGKMIPHPYSLSDLSGKQKNRLALLNQMGLPIRDKSPLVGMVTRLAAQKGIDLLVESADDLMKLGCQVVVLGTGEAEYHRALQKLEKKYPDQLKVSLEFNDPLAHLILAGADIFLMPSRYEPCGLNQMYALRFGTVPVVRAVGGLADTVRDYDSVAGDGTGFLFEKYTVKAMLAALNRACELFRNREAWDKLMKGGMREDFSWAASAARYGELYRSLGSDS
jgi:starch synthase